MNQSKGERSLIDWIRRRTVGDAAAVPIGPGDDMARVVVGEPDGLLTTDTLLEGTHFRLDEASPRQVGYKALAVSVSDCAAMAAEPVAAVAWVALPEDRDMAFAEGLSAGLLECAERFACPLVGGDVTSWAGGLAVGTSVVARAAGIEPVRRRGARPGDVLLVTGRLGGSVLGRHLGFVPRVAEARRLAALVPIHAMIDLSDGLSTDLDHILRESGAGAEVDAPAVPVSPDAERLAARDGRSALAHALSDGEDFELLLAVSAEDAARLAREAPLGEVPLTAVGRVVEGEGAVLVAADGSRRPLAPAGYEHFRGKGRA
jgi:thiamine-monophosphate kinase